MTQIRFILIFLAIVVSLHAEDGIIIDTDSLHVELQFDTIPKTNIFNASGAKFFIPAVFISYGALAKVSEPLQRFDENIDREVSKHFSKRMRFDDYLEVASILAPYGPDLFGIKSKHNFRDKTFVFITSNLIMGSAVYTLKKTTNIERPDGWNYYSFPSGHTATAFVAAHILFKEYKDMTPWIGITGYAVATTMGTMRILNRKHWLSDVVAGAGIGILSVEIGYMLLPVFRNIIGAEQTRSTLTIAPIIGNNQYGLGMVYVF